MKHKSLLISLLLLSAIVLGACGAQVAITEVMSKDEMSAGEVMEEKSDEMMAEEIVDDAMNDEAISAENGEMAEHNDDAMNDDMRDSKDDFMEDESMAAEGMMAPDWFSASLINADTGESFTVADFKGKVVLVETLAMWCSNCLKQQGQVAALHDLLGDRDDFVSLGIDIDPNENEVALKAYTSQNGFDWLYTIAPVDVAREIGQLYGDQFLNPPSTPMLIIDRQGEVHPLPFGIKSAESLLEALQPFLEN